MNARNYLPQVGRFISADTVCRSRHSFYRTTSGSTSSRSSTRVTGGHSHASGGVSQRRSFSLGRMPQAEALMAAVDAGFVTLAHQVVAGQEAARYGHVDMFPGKTSSIGRRRWV